MFHRLSRLWLFVQILLGDGDSVKEATEQKATSDSVSQRSEDYSLNLAEAVRVRMSGQYFVVCMSACSMRMCMHVHLFG